MKPNSHIVSLFGFPAIIIATLFILLSMTGVAEGQTACECYQAGISGQSRPDGCRPHTMGPMTSWMGGFFDRRNNNSNYLDENDWCNPVTPDVEASSAGENRTGYGAIAPPRYATHSVNTREACTCGNDTSMNVLYVRAGAERCSVGTRYSCEVGYSGLAGWSPRGGTCLARDYCMDTVEGPRGNTNRPLSTSPTETSSSEGPNSCVFARDNECDEPYTCSAGTDSADCRPTHTQIITSTPNAGSNSCMFAHDNECDEPLVCPAGTDTADCRPNDH